MPKPKSVSRALCCDACYLARLKLWIALCLGLAFVEPAVAQTVERVEVRGAEFIPKDDIRMTCGAETGIVYAKWELRAIEDCLMSTGVFESVTLSRKDSTLFIDVKEVNTRPGRIDATLAYASQDGVIGSLSFEQYNLFDRTYGAAQLEANADVVHYSANLYRKELFGTELDLGFELAGGRATYDDRSYTEESLRAETYLAWATMPSIRLEGGVGYRDYRMYDLQVGASPLLVREKTDGISAPYLRFGLRHKFSVSGTDDQSDGQAFGYTIDLNQYFWNLGTGEALRETRMDANMQVPIASNLRLLLGMNLGSVAGTSSNATRAIDRYFPGADRFRGFAPRGMGPRDGKDTLGGNHFARASIELQRDFLDVFPAPVRGGVFLDTGGTWRLDDTLGGAIDDSFHRRSSVGVSMTFDVGQTPVSIYLANPIEKQAGDKTQIFGLSLTTRF
ncbi:BamA/TamA family outer membrane protein [Roseobacter sp. N2S]|uniref:BamA/TamA family outer membrane protein n=1 Tax=Roseobacter sp. N2S TaxID=2663844 RepID=UPI0028612126|nr:BamA/TamA family outer membrane protein [Roseobacter sp. N2S]MDR6267714.1 outer membrane protein insertion porin family [Roseobacter sp. N2S]